MIQRQSKRFCPDAISRLIARGSRSLACVLALAARPARAAVEIPLARLADVRVDCEFLLDHRNSLEARFWFGQRIDHASLSATAPKLWLNPRLTPDARRRLNLTATAHAARARPIERTTDSYVVEVIGDDGVTASHVFQVDPAFVWKRYWGERTFGLTANLIRESIRRVSVGTVLREDADLRQSVSVARRAAGGTRLEFNIDVPTDELGRFYGGAPKHLVVLPTGSIVSRIRVWRADF